KKIGYGYINSGKIKTSGMELNYALHGPLLTLTKKKESDDAIFSEVQAARYALDESNEALNGTKNKKNIIF
ncbi:MAG: hypothetical protein ACYSR9_04540, partial [Planctomycetota bacterium]